MDCGDFVAFPLIGAQWLMTHGRDGTHKDLSPEHNKLAIASSVAPGALPVVVVACQTARESVMVSIGHGRAARSTSEHAHSAVTCAMSHEKSGHQLHNRANLSCAASSKHCCDHDG